MAEVTIKTIAAEAGVSISLVSQVLNDRPVRVSKQTKERILSVARQYQYVPNKLAIGLKSKRTKIIALIAPFTPNGFFSNLIYHVQHYATQAGYLSIVINTFDTPEREREALNLYHSGMFDGMLVASRNDGYNLDVFERMKSDGFPFVFVDRFQSGVVAPVVSTDHVSVSRMMTRLALQSGKKNIAYMYNQASHNSALARRMEGYRQEMSEAGLVPSCYGFSATESGGTEYVDGIVQTLKTLEDMPEVFFVHSGYYVPHLVYACKKIGYPLNRLGFLTVDGYSFNERWEDIPATILQIEGHCDVAIQDIDMIAKESVDILLAWLDGEPVSTDPTYVPVRTVKF